MLSFGFGAATPLALVGLLSRRVLLRWRGRMMLGGKAVKVGLGLLLALLGALIVSGLDRQLETWLVDASPAWLTTLTTSFLTVWSGPGGEGPPAAAGGNSRRPVEVMTCAGRG